jgi:hypothetical protein
MKYKLIKLITALCLVVVSGCVTLTRSTNTVIVRVGTEDGVDMCVQKTGTSTSSPFKCPS